MSIPMDSVGAAAVRRTPAWGWRTHCARPSSRGARFPPLCQHPSPALTASAPHACARAQALAKALENGPAPPGAYNNKGGFDSYSQHAQVDYASEVNGVVVAHRRGAVLSDVRRRAPPSAALHAGIKGDRSSGVVVLDLQLGG